MKEICVGGVIGMVFALASAVFITASFGAVGGDYSPIISFMWGWLWTTVGIVTVTLRST